MNRFLSNFVLSSLVVVQSIAPVQARDIISPQADLYIRVTKDRDLRGFELCSKSKGLKSCQSLGLKSAYSIDELEDARLRLQLVAAGKTAGVAVGAIVIIAAGTVLGGPYAGVLLGLTGNLANAALGGFIASTAVSAGVVASKLGPVEQYKQQYLLRAEVVNDEEVKLEGVSDEAMQKIAHRVDRILKKI